MADSYQSQSQIQPTTTARSGRDSKHTLDPALHEACVSGNLDLLISLLSASSSSSSSPSSTNSPPSSAVLSQILYVSTSKNHPNIVDWALSHGATLDPRTLQVMFINRSRDVFEYLLTSPAHTNTPSSDPSKAKPKLDINTYIPWWGDILSNVARRNDTEWTFLCLDHGANPNLNLVDEHKSLLAAVAELSSVEIARLLIERGGATVKGSGAIVMAAEEGKLDMVQFLLERGADVNEIGIEHPTDPRYQEDVGTALHRAVWGGWVEVVRFLLGVDGVDLKLKDGVGRTVMQIAEEGGNVEILEMLRERERERERQVVK